MAVVLVVLLGTSFVTVLFALVVAVELSLLVSVLGVSAEDESLVFELKLVLDSLKPALPEFDESLTDELDEPDTLDSDELVLEELLLITELEIAELDEFDADELVLEEFELEELSLLL